MTKILFSILETIIVYIIFIILLEYTLTEKFLVFPAISSFFKTAIFLIFLFVFLIIIYWKNFRIREAYWIILVFLTFLSLFIYQKYNLFYTELQKYPKIFKISSNWGIQGTKIEILGKNFGPEWLPGEVKVGDLKFIVKYWSPGKIIIEQPVPSKFFKDKLYVENYYGCRSNLVDFEVLDPKYLSQRK